MTDSRPTLPEMAVNALVSQQRRDVAEQAVMRKADQEQWRETLISAARWVLGDLWQHDWSEDIRGDNYTIDGLRFTLTGKQRGHRGTGPLPKEYRYLYVCKVCVQCEQPLTDSRMIEDVIGLAELVQDRWHMHDVCRYCMAGVPSPHAAYVGTDTPTGEDQP